MTTTTTSSSSSSFTATMAPPFSSAVKGSPGPLPPLRPQFTSSHYPFELYPYPYDPYEDPPIATPTSIRTTSYSQQDSLTAPPHRLSLSSTIRPDQPPIPQRPSPPPPIPQRPLNPHPPPSNPSPSPSPPDPTPHLRRLPVEILSLLIHDVLTDVGPTPFPSISEFHFVSARAAFLRDEVVQLLPGRTLISLKGLMEEGRRGLWDGWADRLIAFQKKGKGRGRGRHERLTEGEPRLNYFFFDGGDVIGILFQLHSVRAEVLREGGSQEVVRKRGCWKGCFPLL